VRKQDQLMRMRAVLLVIGLASSAAFADAAFADTAFLSPLDTYHTGLFKKSAAEIPSFCPRSKRVFVVNAESGKVDVFGLDQQGQLSPAGVIDAASDGGGDMTAVNSVSVKAGVVAVAVEAGKRTDPGAVVFYDTETLACLGSAAAGALPDMVTFTPDGHFVLVANEGEPSEDYTVDPEGTVTVIDVSDGFADPPTQTVDFRAWNDGGPRVAEIPELAARGLRLFGRVCLDAKGEKTRPSTVSEDLEPEWIAVEPSSERAYVCLQEANAVAEIEIKTATATRLLPLGFKDHGQADSGIDASDKDGTIAIQPWPGLFGVFQPDTIRLTAHDGRLLLVTANEGDSRLRPSTDDAVPGLEEGDLFNDEASLDDWPLEGTPFAGFAEESKLGRLKLVRDLVQQHQDAEGRPTRLFAFGGRSFSIFDVTTGELVFDSGDDFEQMVGEGFPKVFNVSNDSLKKEKRSRSKGPEPEGLAIGEIDGRTYAFIGLERIGGIMVYDITEPEQSQHIGYYNNRGFDLPATLADGSSNPEAGDSGPEGLLFIPKQQSPTGTNLLIVGNETSGTTTVWEVAPCDEVVLGD
jgi:2',3'-cyclic-nucleotide 2'-phosphodiesterase/3'-nucleotidase/5'-nucleotidase